MKSCDQEPGAHVPGGLPQVGGCARDGEGGPQARQEAEGGEGGGWGSGHQAAAQEEGGQVHVQPDAEHRRWAHPQPGGQNQQVRPEGGQERPQVL